MIGPSEKQFCQTANGFFRRPLVGQIGLFKEEQP